jgi:hypothetical protein
VEGEVAAEPVGDYTYVKRLRVGEALCRVEVFALKVVLEHDLWPERAQRTRQWFSAADAAAAVQEPALKGLIEAFGRSQAI